MQEIKLNVEGMMCSGCENRVKTAVGLIKGVQEVTANHETGEVVVKSKENIDINLVKEKITNLDFVVKD